MISNSESPAGWTNPLLEPQKLLFQSDRRARRRDSPAVAVTAASPPSLRSVKTDSYSSRAAPISTIVSMMPAAGMSSSGDHRDKLDLINPGRSGGDAGGSSGSSVGVSGSGLSARKHWPGNRGGVQAPAAAPVIVTGGGATVNERFSRAYGSYRDYVAIGEDRGSFMDPDQGPVDRLIALVSEGVSLSKRVLGNERQSARLGGRLSALKTPLWQLQARVKTQAERPPDFIYTLSEEVSGSVDFLQELTDPDWWNQICRKDDAAVFRHLNERLTAAVRGDRPFEVALNFPRAADEDRADRIVDFEHLQGVLELHAERLEDRAEERDELWKAIAELRLSEPRDITGFVEIDRAQLTFGSGMPLGESGSCLEATWHGARVAVKRLLPPVKFGSGGVRIGAGGRGGGGGARRVFSAAEASAVRREMRALQSLRFDFLVPIYGACTSPPDSVSVVMPLAPYGSLHALLHGGGGGGGGSGLADTSRVRQHGGVLRRGITRSVSIVNNVAAQGVATALAQSPGGGGEGGGGSSDGGSGRARLSAVEKAAMAFDIARGMLHLHDNGFLHGTLKSKNVMVFENNRLVVSDYGLLTVKSIREKCSSEFGFFGERRSKGTPPPPPPAGSGSEEAIQWRGEKESWVAPEVSAGGEHTQQSDLYNYGGVLFELLAEQLPPSPVARGLESAHSEPTLSVEEHFGGYDEVTWTPKVPQGVEAHLGQVQLMQRCLRHDCEQRPGGFYVIVSFLHDLVKSLGGDDRRRGSPVPGANTSRCFPNGSPGAVSSRDALGVVGDGDAANEPLRNALEAQARLERRLAEAEARCAELEEADRKRKASLATANASTADALPTDNDGRAENVEGRRRMVVGGGARGSPAAGRVDGSAVEDGSERYARVGRLRGKGSENGSGAERERGAMNVSVKTSASQSADNIENSIGGAGGRDGGGGILGSGSPASARSLELRLDGGGRSPERVRRGGLATQMQAGQERERAMRGALEALRRREEAMREELVRGLAGTRVLRAQLREGDKRREQELLAAAADCVSTAKLSPSSAASGPSVTSVASLEAEEQPAGTTTMAGESGARKFHKFATSSVVLSSGDGSITLGDKKRRSVGASGSDSGASDSRSGVTGSSAFTSTPGVSTSEVALVLAEVGAGVDTGSRNSSSDGRTVNISMPMGLTPGERRVWELGRQGEVVEARARGNEPRSAKVLSSTEQLKVAAASMLRDSMDESAGAGGGVGRQGRGECRKTKIPDRGVGSSSRDPAAASSERDLDLCLGSSSDLSVKSDKNNDSGGGGVRRGRVQEREVASSSGLSANREQRRGHSVSSLSSRSSGGGGGGSGTKEKSERRDLSDELQKERLLRKKVYEEKAVAEAEIARLKDALAAKTIPTTAVQASSSSFSSPGHGGAVSAVGKRVKGKNGHAATATGTASGRSGGGKGTGGVLAPMATVAQQRNQQQQQQQQYQPRALPVSSAAMRFSGYPAPPGTAAQLEQEHSQFHQHGFRTSGSFNDGGNAPSAGMVPAHVDDRAALAVLFRSCHGPRWLRRAGWSAGSDERTGVAWTSDRSRLIKLELGTNRVEGYMPKELGALSRLLCLRLDHNHLLGMIPPELGCLTALQQLELQGNALTGSIPPELGALVNLQYLGLHENQLLGEIPSELGGLKRLKHFALCNNRLVGTIPEELGNLSGLEQMYFNHNHLSGPIPSTIGNLSNLNKLRLESNQLSGGIPVELGRLTRLQYVNFGFNGAGNCLTGEIPVRAFANMPQLAWLSITDNPCLIVKRGRFGSSTLSLLKKALPPRCDVFV